VTREGKFFVAEFIKNSGQTQWTNEVGQVKKVRGDTLSGGETRVKAIKMTVTSKKVAIFSGGQ